MRTDNSRLPTTGLISLGIVYLVWGSTYLAIRVAMREGSGFTPFSLGASRTAVSAAVLLLFGYFRFRRRRLEVPNKRDAVTIMVSGFALWIGGNAMVMIAEKRVDSGIAALLVGTVPLWMTIVEALWDKKLPSIMVTASMLTGFAGLAVLTRPILMTGTRADMFSVAILVFAPLSWSFGSVLQIKRPISLPLTYSAGYQQLSGFVYFFVLAVAFREPLPSPTPPALGAFLYLAIFGGVVTFSAYLTALKLLPTSLVATYAYVNPIIAVFLGCVILGEPLSLDTVLGTLLILGGIAGVFRAKRKNTALSSRKD